MVKKKAIKSPYMSKEDMEKTSLDEKTLMKVKKLLDAQGIVMIVKKKLSDSDFELASTGFSKKEVYEIAYKTAMSLGLELVQKGIKDIDDTLGKAL